MSRIVDALQLLTPYEIDIEKIRIGPNTDGGYVLADTLSSPKTVLSYGISTEYRFDEVMASRGHRVYMFDHTIEPLDLADPNLVFFSEGVAAVSRRSEKLGTIASHIQRLGIAGQSLILKIDVEGSEFEVFDGMDDATLASFEQIVMELHGLSRLGETAFRDVFIKVLAKINRFFTLFHVHANNYDGAEPVMAGGLPVANLIELSYVRTNKVRPRPNETLYPSQLDSPCVDGPDKLLWFFPFLPTSISSERFRSCDQRNERLAKRRAALRVRPDRDFDVSWYGRHYGDLSGCTEDYLRDHFLNHGIGEGRYGSAAERDAFENDTI